MCLDLLSEDFLVGKDVMAKEIILDIFSSTE